MADQADDEESYLEVDEMMNRFRLASREMFNNHFRFRDPRHPDAWHFEMCFRHAQSALFEHLVCETLEIDGLPYGTPQPNIQVLIDTDCVSAMIRATAEGPIRWDNPIDWLTPSATLSFIEFFDWNQLAPRDNRYVMVEIVAWPARPQVVGLRALVEAQDVTFAEPKPLC